MSKRVQYSDLKGQILNMDLINVLKKKLNNEDEIKKRFISGELLCEYINFFKDELFFYAKEQGIEALDNLDNQCIISNYMDMLNYFKDMYNDVNKNDVVDYIFEILSNYDIEAFVERLNEPIINKMMDRLSHLIPC